MSFTTIALIVGGAWFLYSMIKDNTPGSAKFEEKYGKHKIHLGAESRKKKRLLIDQCNIMITKEMEKLGIMMSDVFNAEPDSETMRIFNRVQKGIKESYVSTYPNLFSSITDFDINNL